MNKSIKSILFRIIVIMITLFYFILNKDRKKDKLAFIFLSEEFYHKDLGGFSGFGKTVKNITDYINTKKEIYRGNVLITKELNITNIQEKEYHNAKVILRPKSHRYIRNYIKTAEIVNRWKSKIAITMEYYPSYEGFLLSFPLMPCIIWIKDPRDTEEWRKISTVPLEIEAYGKSNPEALLALAIEKMESLQRVIKVSKLFRRKVIFVTQALSIVGIAKNTYGIPDLNPYFLPNPINMPEIDQPGYSEKPSVCFLGRIDPIKRPWIFFELAKRFKNVDFIVAGETHFSNIMNPVINRYKNISNLKFVGHVSGQAKINILKDTWALVNTSIHEAVPVSFLESFSFYKPVISCQNPDNIVGKYGYYTGELLGEGFDDNTLDKFSDKIAKLIDNKDERFEKGIEARKYVHETHSFSNFEKQLASILKTERIV